MERSVKLQSSSQLLLFLVVHAIRSCLQPVHEAILLIQAAFLLRLAVDAFVDIADAHVQVPRKIEVVCRLSEALAALVHGAQIEQRLADEHVGAKLLATDEEGLFQPLDRLLLLPHQKVHEAQLVQAVADLLDGLLRLRRVARNALQLPDGFLRFSDKLQSVATVREVVLDLLEEALGVRHVGDRNPAHRRLGGHDGERARHHGRRHGFQVVTGHARLDEGPVVARHSGRHV
eukprot:scaffold869_cov303-Pinguiococcus_pyrenoidosus.AAC.23